jgi:DNA-binding transcriptional LysR family regulator
MEWTAVPMTLSQLRILLAVADYGGFTTAAEHVGSTQPAVSRVIRTLERELQASLFIRHRDGVTPTKAGLVAIHYARETIDSADRLRQEVGATAGRLTGTLRLASLPSATGSLLAHPLRAFTERHPHVRVRLFEGTDQEVRDWLSRGGADLGVVTLPAPGYRCTRLGEDEMVAVLPSAHALAGLAPVAVHDLAGYPFIFPGGGCGPLILGATRRAGITLNVAFEAREPQSVLEMVAAGLGISVMPTLNLAHQPEGILTRALHPRLPRILALALGADEVPNAHAFVDELTLPANPRRPSRAR